MRGRRAPRPAAAALRAAMESAAPRTPLAAAQAVWEEAVGARVAAVAVPESESGGTLVVAVSDPVWAQELDMMQAELLVRLRGLLGDTAPERLRFRSR